MPNIKPNNTPDASPSVAAPDCAREARSIRPAAHIRSWHGRRKALTVAQRIGPVREQIDVWESAAELDEVRGQSTLVSGLQQSDEPTDSMAETTKYGGRPAQSRKSRAQPGGDPKRQDSAASRGSAQRPPVWSSSLVHQLSSPIQLRARRIEEDSACDGDDRAS